MEYMNYGLSNETIHKLLSLVMRVVSNIQIYELDQHIDLIELMGFRMTLSTNF